MIRVGGVDAGYWRGLGRGKVVGAVGSGVPVAIVRDCVEGSKVILQSASEIKL